MRLQNTIYSQRGRPRRGRTMPYFQPGQQSRAYLGAAEGDQAQAMLDDMNPFLKKLKEIQAKEDEFATEAEYAAHVAVYQFLAANVSCFWDFAASKIKNAPDTDECKQTWTRLYTGPAASTLGLALVTREGFVPPNSLKTDAAKATSATVIKLDPVNITPTKPTSSTSPASSTSPKKKEEPKKGMGFVAPFLGLAAVYTVWRMTR